MAIRVSSSSSSSLSIRKAALWVGCCGMRLILVVMAVLARGYASGTNNITESSSTRPYFFLSRRSSTIPPPTVFRSKVTPMPARRSKVDSPMLNYIFDSYATSNKHFHDNFRPPSFEGNMTSQGTAVEADTGATVTLSCRVTSLRDKTVSWLRVSDKEKLELLTLNLDRHAADPRYRIDVAGDTWKMTLTDARIQDSGIYCCHVSTHPPMLKRFRLTVHLPEIKMISESFLERGEMLSLKCSVLHLDSGESVPEMRWFRGSNMMKTIDEIRGGVLIETDHLTMTSHLQVARLRPDDAGNYTCALEAPIRMRATARVHVLHGSSLAELQSGVKTSSSYLSALLICTLLSFWMQCNDFR